jgi:UPF0271 protein
MKKATSLSRNSLIINCDMGEGMGNEAQIMPYIHAANIACGKHAGDLDTMKKTVSLALKNGVHIGAHPSYDDRANFGRQEIIMSFDNMYNLVIQQIEILDTVIKEQGGTLRHIKPHGALYNKSAKDIETAHCIAKAVKAYRPDLVLFGLSGSCAILAAEKLGLQIAHEVFADRTYQDDASLTPRNLPNALIENVDIAIAQVLQLKENQSVSSVSGKLIALKANTVCIHGDTKQAAFFAKAIYEKLK